MATGNGAQAAGLADPIHVRAQYENGAQESEEESSSSEEAEQFRAEEDLDRVLGEDDPDRMKLTEQEHGWAVMIKNMVEMSPDIDDLPDYMYAQLALVCKGNVENAIQRCYGLQDFREEHKVLDEYQEGCRCFEEVFRLFPEQNLSFSFSAKEGTYIFLHDSSKFEPSAFTSAEMADYWLKAMYYWHLNFCPDLESIRRGIIVLVECDGMTLRRDVLKHFSALFSQLLSHYPVNGVVRHYNTGAMMNVLCSMLRPILPKHLQDTFQVGLRFESNVRAAFLSPSVEVANKRLLRNMKAILKRRYDNQEAFEL